MERTLTKIEKNQHKRIRVDLSEFNGHDIVGLRVQVDDGAEFIPAKMRITVASGN